MKYRLIALDLDGTLLDSQLAIRPQTIAALAQACAQGIRVVLVSGRPHVAIYPYHHQLGLDTPAICCNGTCAYDFSARRALSANPLRKEQTLQLLAKARKYGVQGLLYVDDLMTYEADNPRLMRLRTWAAALPENVRPAMVPVEGFERIAEEATTIWKYLAIAQDRERFAQFVSEVESELGVQGEWSGRDRLDIVQTGNSKGARLAEWIATQGIALEEVIAFGDHRNDISMLKMVGMGVAMGNSDEVVQSHARWVAGNNDSDAIAETLQRFVLSA